MAKFVLSAFSDEYSHDFDEQLEGLAKNGLSLMEIRGVNGKNISAVTPDEARELTVLEGQEPVPLGHDDPAAVRDDVLGALGVRAATSVLPLGDRGEDRRGRGEARRWHEEVLPLVGERPAERAGERLDEPHRRSSVWSSRSPSRDRRRLRAARLASPEVAASRTPPA
mgnify:CR=1 FL=1